MHGSSNGMIYEISPVDVILVVFLILSTIFLYRKTWPPTSLVQRITLVTLRSVAFMLLILFIVDPALVSVDIEERKAVLPVLIDVSRSMGLSDCNGRSRLEAAKEDIYRLKEMFPDTRIDVIPFASNIPAGVCDLDSLPGAEGEGTDFFGSIKWVQDKYQSKNMPAVIILSDGRVTGGMTASGASIPVRVFTVGYGDTLEGVDLRIEEVYYERTIFSGTRARIETLIRAEGIKENQVTVDLYEDKKLIDSVRVSVPGGKGELRAVLHFRAGKEGQSRLKVAVRPAEGENSIFNNNETLRITVLKEKTRILFIDQYADWNMTFFRDILEKSERFELDTVTWMPTEGYHTLPERDRWSFPRELSGLDRYDIVIIGDDERLFVSTYNVEVLDAFVRGGGGVLLLASEDSPLRNRVSMQLLERFLPITGIGKGSIVYGEFFVKSTSGTGDSRLAAIMDATDALDKLPPLPAVISGFEVKAGAEVSLYLCNGVHNFPMVAVQRHDNGVSAVILGFPIWRWRLAGESGALAYRTIVTGLIEYVTEGINLPAMVLNADRTVYRAGEKSKITAQVRTAARITGIRGEVYSVLDGNEDLVRTFNFELSRGREDIFRAVLEPLVPGDYRITATGTTRSGEIISGETEVVVEPVSIEFARRSRDSGFLRRLARSSGAVSLEANEIAKLATLIDPVKDTIKKREIVPLSNNPFLFVCMIIVLAAEWILRKVWGMV